MSEIAAIQAARYDDERVIDTIRQTVCKGASDAQLQMFLEVCRRTGLDPFLKEIWFIAEKSIIMAGRDGYLRVANEHPMFDGIETRVERDADKTPVKAICTVWRKDRSHPTICEAFFNEYKGGSPVWTKYPSAMISKVAEVLALKRSFAINGVVSEEEMEATLQPSPAEAHRQVAARKTGEVPAQEPSREAQSSAGDTADAELEAIRARMRDRTSIGEALRGLLHDLASRIGDDAARSDFERLLTRYGADKWESLRSVKIARQFAGDLYTLVRQAPEPDQDPELFAPGRDAGRDAPYAE